MAGTAAEPRVVSVDQNAKVTDDRYWIDYALVNVIDCAPRYRLAKICSRPRAKQFSVLVLLSCSRFLAHQELTSETFFDVGNE